MTQKEVDSLEIGDMVEVTCSGPNKGKQGTVVRFVLRRRCNNYVIVRPLTSFEGSAQSYRDKKTKLPIWSTRFLKKI